MSDTALQWQRIARPPEGGAVCFDLKVEMHLDHGGTIGLDEQGFAICFRGAFRAWRNRCPHAGSPLDWQPGRFFSEDGEQLLCHTHGARFDPLDGACLAGPCPRGLESLPLRECGDVLEVPLRLAQ